MQDNYDKFVEHEKKQAKAEEAIVKHCSECGGPIYEGDSYYKVDGKDYCKDCISDCERYADGN